MEYIIQVCADYVEAVASGEVDLLDGKACLDEILQLCHQHHLSKVLVNGLQLSDRVSVSSRFGLGEYLAAAAAPGVRVAILTTTQLLRQSKALENTANNRGAQVITTDSMDEALAFLGSKST